MRTFSRDETEHGQQYVLLSEAMEEVAELQRAWDMAVFTITHAISELEILDDETAQAQAEALRALLTS